MNESCDVITNLWRVRDCSSCAAVSISCSRRRTVTSSVASSTSTTNERACSCYTRQKNILIFKTVGAGGRGKGGGHEGKVDQLTASFVRQANRSFSKSLWSCCSLLVFSCAKSCNIIRQQDVEEYSGRVWEGQGWRSYEGRRGVGGGSM